MMDDCRVMTNDDTTKIEKCVFFMGQCLGDENKPYTGSFFPPCARANTGKSRKTAPFLSCGEYAL